MAHDQFPMFKLATLLARQMSAPIARNIKEYAKDHPSFGRQVCGRIARVYSACELRYKIWSLQVRRKSHSQLDTLSNQQAINLGADILGEMIIFMLGACIIIFEVNRQAMNKQAQVLEKKSERVALALTLEELQRELKFQQADINRLHAELIAIEKAKTDDEDKSPGDRNR